MDLRSVIRRAGAILGKAGDGLYWALTGLIEILMDHPLIWLLTMIVLCGLASIATIALTFHLRSAGYIP